LKRWTLVFWLFIAALIMASCAGTSQGPENSTSIVTETPLPTATPADTPTPRAPIGVFLTPAGSDQNMVESLNPLLGEYLRNEGLRYQVLPKITQEDFQRDDYRFVVALPPFPELGALAKTTPGTKFLAVGFSDLEPAENISVLKPGGGNFDVQGFIAGYIAAMITPDWRVAVLSVQESEEALAARDGFRVGVKYYCGLCNPKYAPTGINYIYPKYIDLPVDASDLEAGANIDFLVDRAVQTVYVVPGVGTENIYRTLVGYQRKIIGSGSDFKEEYQEFWVVSLEYDLVAALQEFWPAFLSAENGLEATPPLLLTDINYDLLSEGKVIQVEKILEEVTGGYIKTSFVE
jgi:hypothetical protein